MLELYYKNPEKIRRDYKINGFNDLEPDPNDRTPQYLLEQQKALEHLTCAIFTGSQYSYESAFIISGFDTPCRRFFIAMQPKLPPDILNRLKKVDVGMEDPIFKPGLLI